jgi:hypothetical protein
LKPSTVTSLAAGGCCALAEAIAQQVRSVATQSFVIIV